jgi:hypothetical protein
MFSFPGSARERTPARLCLAAFHEDAKGTRRSGIRRLATFQKARQSLAGVRSQAEPGNEEVHAPGSPFPRNRNRGTAFPSATTVSPNPNRGVLARSVAEYAALRLALQEHWVRWIWSQRPIGVVAMRAWISAAVLIALAVACCPFLWLGFWAMAAQKGKNYFSGLDAARPSAPYVSDFVRLFPDAQVHYRYFTAGREPGFDVMAILYERYDLTMQLPAIFDFSGRKVVGYGPPAFYLNEAEKVEGRSISYKSSQKGSLGAPEWQKIVAAGGDFEAIGYKLTKDRPVLGFRALMTPGR